MSARAASRALLLAGLATLLWASCAQAASAPTAVTGPNTPEPGGKVRLLGYVGPEGSKVSACKFIYGSEAGNYTSEAPCANHPGNEVRALTVGATGGQFRLSLPEFNGTTGTGDLTAGSKLITNVTTATGEFRVGQPIRSEGIPSFGAPEIIAIGSGTIEMSGTVNVTKTAAPLQSERLEITADLPFDASAAEVQAALEALPGIGPGGVSVTRPVETPDYRLYLIAFQGPLADTNVEGLKGESGSEPLQVGPGQALQRAVETRTLIEGGLTEPHEATANLTGLTPGATYHYRLVAENAAGKAESPDAIFKALEEPSTASCPNAGAPGAGFLPECRAWEMVSPPQKNGGDITTDFGETRIAADGSAAEFASPSPFADASGAGARSTYEAIRTPSGWQTHGILPAQPPDTFHATTEGLEPHYQGEFSADLQEGSLSTFRPLDNSDPNVEEVTNLYLRTDLRSPGPGHYRLLTKCPLCAEEHKQLEGVGGNQLPAFIGASADFKHLIFESTFNLVKPATGTGRKLYEDEEGTLRLAGILPNGSAASESKAALHFGLRRHSVSSDGSKVFFLGPPFENCNHGLPECANLYMRLNHETTVKLNESELPSPEEAKPASFRDITPDGAKVFFTTEERLTEDAPTGGGLYVYDTAKPAGDHNLTFIDPHSHAILGASADGNTVYFDGTDQLPDLPKSYYASEALYVWHAGQLRFVADVYGHTAALEPEDILERGGIAVSADGQLLFASEVPALGLTGHFPGYCPTNGITEACEQLYTYDPETEALQCASCGPPGLAIEGLEASFFASIGGVTRQYHYNTPISSDGSHVFFNTNAPLVPEDTNGVTDAYTFDTATGQVSLLSRGTDSSPSYFLEASPDGSNALFTTRQRLSGWDIDSNADLYDARVGGGLPEPVSVAASCEGEACLPAPPPSPAREANGSGHFEGKGNVRAPCPHGTRIVHRAGKTRCVKPKHSRKKHRRRAHR